MAEPPKRLGDEPVDPDAVFRATNPIMQKFSDLREAFEQLEEDKFRFLIITGPPGINKSGETILFLGRVYKRSHALWLAQPEDLRPPRRTYWDSIGNCLFVEPFVFRGGQIEAPAFFHYLHRTIEPDEYFVLDDVISLNNRENRSMLQQAADSKRLGEVTRETNATRRSAKKGDGPPPTIHHKGKMVLITNDQRDGPEAKLKFGEALQDRGFWIEFPWGKEPLIEYVDHMAFGTDPNAGLYKYLLGHSTPAMDEDDKGLAFKGSEDEAFQMLSDVRQHFLANAYRMRVIGFRALRRFLFHRRWTPGNWRQKCESDLLSKAA